MDQTAAIRFWGLMLSVLLMSGGAVYYLTHGSYGLGVMSSASIAVFAVIAFRIRRAGRR